MPRKHVLSQCKLVQLTIFWISTEPNILLNERTKNSYCTRTILIIIFIAIHYENRKVEQSPNYSIRTPLANSSTTFNCSGGKASRDILPSVGSDISALLLKVVPNCLVSESILVRFDVDHCRVRVRDKLKTYSRGR